MAAAQGNRLPPEFLRAWRILIVAIVCVSATAADLHHHRSELDSELGLELELKDIAYPSPHLHGVRADRDPNPPPCGPKLESLVVDGAAVQRQIDELATLSDAPAPSVTRVLFTENDVAARWYVRKAMSAAGLTVREDPIGNIFGRWNGADAAGVVGTGSHTDAIPHAGKYDGVVGVLGAIEAVRALRKAGFVPKKSLEVIMFTSEEPTRFGFGCLGSRAMAASEKIFQILRESVDANGVSFADAAKQAGYLPSGEEELEAVAIAPGTYSAFVELHIEQGPSLEAEGVQIGVVTAIAAPASLKVDLKGDGGHAGALLMPFRNDAGLAAAELALAVEEHVLATGSIDTVGTTGVMELHPGAVNSVPRQAHLEIDVRDVDGARRDEVVEKIRLSASSIAKKRNVLLQSFEVVNQDPPAQCGAEVVRAAVEATERLGYSSKLMKSRAYHDSLFMARLAPAGMIFIPCYKGYSHHPDEFSSPEDIARGIEVLAITLAKLSLA